jgi:hypothetical protein
MRQLKGLLCFLLFLMHALYMQAAIADDEDQCPVELCITKKNLPQEPGGEAGLTGNWGGISHGSPYADPVIGDIYDKWSYLSRFCLNDWQIHDANAVFCATSLEQWQSNRMDTCSRAQSDANHLFYYRRCKNMLHLEEQWSAATAGLAQEKNKFLEKRESVANKLNELNGTLEQMEVATQKEIPATIKEINQYHQELNLYATGQRNGAGEYQGYNVAELSKRRSELQTTMATNYWQQTAGVKRVIDQGASRILGGSSSPPVEEKAIDPMASERYRFLTAKEDPTWQRLADAARDREAAQTHVAAQSEAVKETGDFLLEMEQLGITLADLQAVSGHQLASHEILGRIYEISDGIFKNLTLSIDHPFCHAMNQSIRVPADHLPPMTPVDPNLFPYYLNTYSDPGTIRPEKACFSFLNQITGYFRETYLGEQKDSTLCALSPAAQMYDFVVVIRDINERQDEQIKEKHFEECFNKVINNGSGVEAALNLCKVFLTRYDYDVGGGLKVIKAAQELVETGKCFNKAASSIVRQNYLNGKAAEESFHAIVGGERNVYRATDFGPRYIDIFFATEKKAIEIKLGRVALNHPDIISQIGKDIYLLKNLERSNVKVVEWHFFSSVTGRGPTKTLRRVLEQAGIKIVEH